MPTLIEGEAGSVKFTVVMHWKPTHNHSVRVVVQMGERMRVRVSIDVAVKQPALNPTPAECVLEERRAPRSQIGLS
jgi:hypothetical protein